MTEKSMRGDSIPSNLPNTVSTGIQISVCPSCGYPRDLAAFEHCDLCRQALRDENDLEAKTDPFEKVQEALARTWSEFAATEDFRNRMALAQEIELLNVEGGI